MNILLVGSGAREHALARAIKRSKHHTDLYCYGSTVNPGIQELSTNYTTGDLQNVAAIVHFAQHCEADWAIIGPEPPLAAGVTDALTGVGIHCIGPTRRLAQIETSKSFTRDLLTDHGIHCCPRYQKFSSLVGVASYLKNELNNNYVIKADGLMGGKGVKVAGEHLQSAEETLTWCQQILARGMPFVVEEKLIGQEFSLMSFSDGEHVAHMPAVQDHKRAFAGDTGPNTGGMGSYSDANHTLPFLTRNDIAQAQAINLATIQALESACGETYKGILYGGFMATADGIRLIEYNARFGDPEAMNVLAILESDFVDICEAIITGQITQNHARFAHRATVCKYAVPEGYPNDPVKDRKIDVSEVRNREQLYYAAVDQRQDGFYETGSRTVATVGIAETIAEAEQIAEEEIRRVKGPLFHRADIGKEDLIKKRVAMMNDLRYPIKLAILGSTRGTSMQPIIDTIERGGLNASIEVVISNQPNAYILERAKIHGLKALCVDMKKERSLPTESKKTREEYDHEIMKMLDEHRIDLLLLIGYMRLLSPTFVNKWRNKIMNVHPSLLPKFAGGMDLDVHQIVLASGEKETGCTIHWVDEGADTGEIIVQKKCAIDQDDTPKSLKAKVQKLEGEAFIEAIKWWQSKQRKL